MRCRECNIDLASDCERCPLCGALSSDDAPVLSGLADIPYDRDVKETAEKKHKMSFADAAGRAAGAASVLGIGLCAAGIKNHSKALANASSAVCCAAAAVSFACCAAEKRELAHGAVPLLLSTVAGTLSAGISAAGGFAGKASLPCAAACAVMQTAACVLKKEPVVEQYRAFFRMTGEEK